MIKKSLNLNLNAYFPLWDEKYFYMKHKVWRFLCEASAILFMPSTVYGYNFKATRFLLVEMSTFRNV